MLINNISNFYFFLTVLGIVLIGLSLEACDIQPNQSIVYEPNTTNIRLKTIVPANIYNQGGILDKFNERGTK